MTGGSGCVLGSCTATDHDKLRLVGGSTDHEGRLEMCRDGHWGTICDDSWDDTDSSVACRQLGFAGGSGMSGSLHVH